MPRGSFALVLSGVIATQAFAGSVDDSSVQSQLAELRALIQQQQEQLQKQKLRIEKEAETRRLQSAAEVVADINSYKSDTNAAIAELDAAMKATDGDIQGAMDHIWLILCGAIVMIMQAGFACVEAGCCRAKNVQNILLKNLTDVAVGTLGWWSFGFAFAYGNPDTDEDGLLDNDFMGTENFFGIGFLQTDEDGKQIPAGGKMLAWFFQWAFCSAAATIVSGGVAERVNFPGYCVYSFSMCTFIYPVVVAWTWGYGWLEHVNDIGYMDFAGSGIVHMSGGVGALVGATIAGPRMGRWDPAKESEFVPHSLPLIVLGTFILWFGWYGFNCGSTLALHTTETGEQAAQVAMNTTVSGAAGGLTVFILRLIALKGHYDIGGFCNGILAGLVSVTAPCSTIDCGSAFVIGIIGAFLYEGASRLLRIIKVDDPIDAFPVHGVCGAWGVLAAALFDWGKGFDYASGWSIFDCKRGDDDKCIDGLWGQLFAANVVEILAISAWVGGLSALVFLPLRIVGFLRAADGVQEKGFDESKHSPSKAYSY